MTGDVHGDIYLFLKVTSSSFEKSTRLFGAAVVAMKTQHNKNVTLLTKHGSSN